MRQSETDMTELIFAATEHLMARNGLDNLSMHKLPKKPKFRLAQFTFILKIKMNCLNNSPDVFLPCFPM